MDPFVTLPLTALALGKLWAWRNRKRCQKLAHRESEAFERLRAEYQVEADLLLDALVELGRTRFGYIKTLHRQAVRLARRLPRRYRAFEPRQGWFAGKTFREVMDLLRAADAAASYSHRFEKDQWSLAFKGVLALQGLEYLDQAGWVQTPLHDSLRTTFDLPPPGTLDIPDGFDAALDLPIADLLSGPLLIFGLWRMARNIELAANAEDIAARFREADQELRQQMELVKKARARIAAIRRDLEVSAYDLFKQAWLLETVSKCLPFMPTRAPDSLVLRFAAACRKFSEVLDRRLDVHPDIRLALKS